MKAQGKAETQTPNLDALVREGVRLERPLRAPFGAPLRDPLKGSCKGSFKGSS